MGLNDRDWFNGLQPPDPNEPSTPSIIDGAIAMHEIYRSYVSAGFREDQALAIVIAMLGMNMPKA